MKNWSKNQQWNPKQFLQPSSKEELVKIIHKALENHQKIRVYGSKHSFTALNNSDQISLNLDNYQGVVKVDQLNNLVTVKSGTKLSNLTHLLATHNLALENMGDVDTQSIAGAIGTGTHGTGKNFGNISTQVRAIEFVDGLGQIVFCSEEQNIELFKSMQISLGALGIITEITLKCLPSYRIKIDKKAEKLSEILVNLPTINKNNRNFEFYWFPYTNIVQSKYLNISEEEVKNTIFLHYVNDVVVENYLFKVLCETAKQVPKLNVGISKLSAKFLSTSSVIKESKDGYVTPRLVKFNEMEYNISIDAYKNCIKDISKLINSKKFSIHFPIENRFVQQDTIYLSPAYKRDSAYIACHVYKGKEYKKYFMALEEIFTHYDGRPHWGKIHFKKADYFCKKYPMFDAFNQQRKKHDPKELFLNKHLREILVL